MQWHSSSSSLAMVLAAYWRNFCLPNMMFALVSKLAVKMQPKALGTKLTSPFIDKGAPSISVELSQL
ncbi:MAG: hypothetical protein ACJAQ6_001570 [Arenicella sp.]